MNTDSDPRHHARQIRSRLHAITVHLRQDVGNLDDAQAKALFETAAETLTGLCQAFEDFENRNEPAWQLART